MDADCFVKDCDCEGNGVKLKPMNMRSPEDTEPMRVVVSFSVGEICCAHCGKNYRPANFDKMTDDEKWAANSAALGSVHTI